MTFSFGKGRTLISDIQCSKSKIERKPDRLVSAKSEDGP